MLLCTARVLVNDGAEVMHKGRRNLSLSAAAIPLGLLTSPWAPSDVGPLPPPSPPPKFPNSIGKTCPRCFHQLWEGALLRVLRMLCMVLSASSRCNSFSRSLDGKHYALMS